MSGGAGAERGEVMIALLRGINVGGRNKLAMSDLRDITEGCGFEDVQTYIQSGNVVFRGPGGSAHADQLTAAITRISGLTPAVVVRTLDEVRAVSEANPFLDRSDDLTHHHVVFTGEDAEVPLAGVDLVEFSPEAAVARGRHVYLFLPGGMGRSRLASDLGRLLDSRATTRNWRTVLKLLEMAQEAAAAE